MSFIAALTLMAGCVVDSAVASGVVFAVNERARRRRCRQAIQNGEGTDVEAWREAAERALFRG